MGGERTYTLPRGEHARINWPLAGRLAAVARRDSALLVVIGLVAVAIALLELLPRLVGPDTWLALAAGRQVAQAGIPHHELLTVFAHGRAWVDEQWLSQLTMYALYRLGGLPLLGAVDIGLIFFGLAGAALAARRLGAAARSLIRVLPVATLCVVPAFELRTEAYALPLFVATVYLLAKDSRQSTRAVYWCLPLLVLWGNLHGSASMGAGLVGLRGLTIAWERRRGLLHAREWERPVVLVVGAPLALLATPYGSSIISYYQATLLNGSMRGYVTEWQPVTASPAMAAALFALAAATVWSFGKHSDKTTLWERCALLALAALAAVSVRNAPWFGLGAIVVLPLSIDAAVRARTRPTPSRPALNLALAGTAVLALVFALASSFSQGQSLAARSYPPGAFAAVRAEVTAHPALRVFADELFADWLLWRSPALQGRVAYDPRFELLSAQQMRAILDLKLVSGLNWKRAARGYRLLVLSTQDDAVRALEREPGRRILFDRAGVVVILRSPAAAVA
jgi:hypothetical protein